MKTQLNIDMYKECIYGCKVPFKIRMRKMAYGLISIQTVCTRCGYWRDGPWLVKGGGTEQ